MQMLSGVPEMVLLTWLVLAALWLGSLRRPDPPIGAGFFEHSRSSFSCAA